MLSNKYLTHDILLASFDNYVDMAQRGGMLSVATGAIIRVWTKCFDKSKGKSEDVDAVLQARLRHGKSRSNYFQVWRAVKLVSIHYGDKGEASTLATLIASATDETRPDGEIIPALQVAINAVINQLAADGMTKVDHVYDTLGQKRDGKAGEGKGEREAKATTAKVESLVLRLNNDAEARAIVLAELLHAMPEEERSALGIDCLTSLVTLSVIDAAVKVISNHAKQVAKDAKANRKVVKAIAADKAEGNQAVA